MSFDEESIRPENLEMAFMKMNAEGKLNFGEIEMKGLFQE